jgi:tripartite-type tricarboxylate transporter receptor subunit TctC
VVVENRAGAAGNIGAEFVSRADPDGYTLMASPPPPLVVNQYLYPRIAFDATQFVPISVMAAVPTVLAVNPKLPAQTLAEFIALARARPGEINFASQGSGSTSHLTTELFMMATGVKLAHVPYKGTAPGLTDLMAGQVDLMFDNLSSSLGFIRAGRLRALAVTSARRVAALPDTPALAESMPGLVSTAWFAVMAPPGTPTEIAAKVSAAISEAIRLPDVQKRLADMLAEPMGLGPADTAAHLRQDAERWKRVIAGGRIRVE